MPGRLEPLDLEPRDAGDEREVVVLRPALLAEREEVAEPAEVDRVGVGRPPPLDRVEKPRAEPAVVGEEVVRPEGLALPRARDDVHGLGRAALDPRELLGVEAELEHVLRLGEAGELGVDDLVSVAVGAALDEVREPTPGAVGERGLVDDVGAVRGWRRSVSRAARVPVAVVEVDGGDARGPPPGAGPGRRPRARPPCAG